MLSLGCDQKEVEFQQKKEKKVDIFGQICSLEDTWLSEGGTDDNMDHHKNCANEQVHCGCSEVP